MWHAITMPAVVPPVEPLRNISFPGLYSVRQFTDEAEARKTLATGYSVDKSWASLRQSDWEVAGLSTGKNIVTVYRKTFTVTPEWLKGLRGVQLMTNGAPSGPMEMAINGTVISGDRGPGEEPEKILATLKPGTNLLTVLAKAGGGGNGGFDNIYSLRRLPAGTFVDISGDWTGYTSDTDSAKVDFPAKGQWTMVRKMVTLTDEERAAGSIWIEIEGNLAAMSVNGHVLYNSSHYGAMYPPGHLYRVNITADLKKDGPNEIGMGPGSWISERFEPGPLEIGSVKLLLVPKK